MEKKKRSGKEVAVQRSIVREIIPLFIKHPVIGEKSITNIFNQEFKRPLSVRDYGFKKLEDFYAKVIIFDRPEKGKLSISRKKLLAYLLLPLAGVQPSLLESEFERVNMFSPQILCSFCQVDSLHTLVHELQQHVKTIHEPEAALSQLQPPSHAVVSVGLGKPVPAGVHNQVGQHIIGKTPLLPFAAAPGVEFNYEPSFSCPPPPRPDIIPLSSSLNVAHSTMPVSGSQLPAVQPHFPNPELHPSDESFLPAIPGHPRLDLPSPSPAILPSRPTFKHKERESAVIEKLDDYTQSFILCLSKQGKHLPLDLVTKELTSIARSQRIHRSRIKSWDNFDKLHKRLDAFIRTFCWNCPFTSLFELERTVNEFENVSSFDDLHIGPILKHPLIQDFFKVPDDIEIVPRITTYDILDAVHAFINRHKKGDNIWDKLEEFMVFLADKHSAKSPQHLCVRISSYRLALSVNMKFRTSQRKIRERREQEAEVKITEAVDFEINRLKRSLSRMSRNEQELIEKPPVKLIEDVYNEAKSLFGPHTQSRLTTFFTLVLKDSRLRKLFTLALYQGAYGVQRYSLELEQQSNSCNAQHETHEVFCHKSQSDLTKALKEILKCLPFPIDLESLARAEQTLMNQMDVVSFSSFQHGSFLQFLANSNELLKCIGGKCIGGSSSRGAKSRRTQIISFISQIKDRSNLDLVAVALKRQFSVESVEHLQCGDLDKLVSDAELQPPAISHEPVISYTFPLLLNDQPKRSQDCLSQNCGLLGSKTLDDAYDCLQKAPLLANLSEWSQWNIVFGPSLGSLHDFLANQKTCETMIFALQDSSGHLLKIDPDSSMKDFVKAVDAADPIATPGRLVSMAVSAGSIHLMSLQLMAGHVTTKLEKMEAERGSSTLMILPECFIFHCLQRIPLELCECLGKQVLIDPLRKVTSATTVNGLMQFCETSSQRCLLQALGLKLGVAAWINDFKEMHTRDYSNQFMRRISSTQPKACNSKTGKGTSPRISEEPRKVEELKTDGRDASSKLKSQSTSKHNINQESIKKMEDIGEEKAKQVISTIRREEFGVGLELNQHQMRIANKQKEREGRGLQRLSRELYSKDTHFVLELIQNADDNGYSLEEDQGVPTLKFVLHKDCIAVLNNEIGFSEENIRAICDVGRSTKDSSRSGYIGQKGIGFKSVFRITHKPEIHSNGFHIQFDTTSGSVGYILPVWIDHSFIEGRINSSELSKWTTKIILPLKSEGSLNMVKKFEDIQPSLLLFLNRLRSILIYDTDSNVERRMNRTDGDAGMTLISHNDGTDYWLVVRKELSDASQYKPDVQATELAIAFPLPEDLQALPSARDLQPQQVFAFLPLRSYGFRFIVQGDFDLPSSREDVNADSAWNQWLREKIPSLFVEAAEKMKALPSLDQVQAICLFVQFIPLEGEVHDFFKPVTSQILRLLRGTQCLPSDPVNTSPSSNEDNFCEIVSLVQKLGHDNEYQITWKQPSQLIRVTHDFIREFIPQSVLANCLNLYYLNSNMVARVTPDLCSHLGIRNMTIDHLLSVANGVLDSYHTKMETGDYNDADSDDSTYSPFEFLVNWVAHWLACVYTILEETKPVNPNTLSQLQKLPIIPLTDESLVSMDSEAVFFPPGSDGADNEKIFKEIYKELRTIDPSLLETGDQVIRGKVYEMLYIKLGVKELNAIDIINHHIIPQFETGGSQNQKMLILYLTYVKTAIDRQYISSVQCSQVIAKLKECVLIVTNQGVKMPTKDNIHFASEYKEQWDLSKLFPGVKWTLLSSKYLGKQSDTVSWRTFFLKLGIIKGLAIERINRKINPQNHKFSYWNTSNWKRSPDGEYTVRDYYCKEFDEIVDSYSSKGKKFELSGMLANMLDRCWDSMYKCSSARYFDGLDEVELGETISTFGASVRDRHWLPAGNQYGNPHTSSSLLKGSELYVQTSETVSLLYNHVPYLGVSLQNQSLLQVIKVNKAVSPETLLEYLNKWSASSHRGDLFKTSVDHMTQVYIFLAKNDKKNAFADKKLIFVPSIANWHGNTQEDVEGKFVSVHDACWRDVTTVIYNSMLREKKPLPSYLPHVLSFFYGMTNDEIVKGEIKHAFTALGVEKGLKLKGLVDLLDYNSSLSPHPEPRHVENFRSIAEVVVSTIIKHGQYAQADQEYGALDETNRLFFISQIKESKVFPSTNKKWTTLNRLYVDDDPEVSQYFIKSEKICFLDWAKSSGLLNRGYNCEMDFIRICKIPSLRNNSKKSLKPGSIRPCDDLQKFFHFIVPLVQLFVVSRMQITPIINGKNYHDYIHELLQRVRIFSTNDLSCVYSVNECDSPIIQVKQCQIDLESSPPVIYAVVDNDGKYLDKSSLVDVLMTLFKIDLKEDSVFHHFLIGLIMNEPCLEEEVRAVIEKYRLGNFPESTDYPRWSVELPEKFLKKDIEKKEENVQEASQEDIEEEREVESQERNVSEEGGLKSWPPKASVEVEPKSSKRKPAQIPEKEFATVSTTKDVVTPDYVEGLRKQAAHEMGDHTEPPTKSEKKRSSDIRSPPVQKSISEQDLLKRKSLQNEQMPDKTSSQSLPQASKTDDRKKSTDEMVSTVDHASNQEKKRSNLIRKTISTEDQNRVSDFQNIQAVEITQLMQSLPVKGTQLKHQMPNEEGKESKMKVGRWGEMFVYFYLESRRILPNGSEISAIRWENEEKESGQPYDIKVTTDRSEYFIEVKSTSSNNLELIPFSWKELQFAKQKAASYCLIRVYNALNITEVHLKWLSDVFGCIETNSSVRLFIKL